jgi:hypothetical protein
MAFASQGLNVTTRSADPATGRRTAACTALATRPSTQTIYGALTTSIPGKITEQFLKRQGNLVNEGVFYVYVFWFKR